MKKLINKLYILTVVLFLGSCGDFGGINTNPNAPVFVGTETLLTGAQQSVSDVVGSYFGELFVQHMSDITYTEDSRYGATRLDFGGWYAGPLANLQKIINLNVSSDTKDRVLSGGSNVNQIGVARIMKAYFFNHIVERWGPLPYSQALKGSDQLLPGYDDESAIYADIIKELKEAAAQLDGGTIKGDIIFKGDTKLWKTFANTLRAQIAIKIADADATLAKATFTDAVNSGLITSTAFYDYLAESANENPWYSRFRTRTDFAISDVFVNFLTSTSDPRLASFADPAKSSGKIVGMPYGLENSSISPPTVSFPHTDNVRGQDKDIPIISMSQVNFMMAEAVARGWITGNAETHYNNAITASMNYWKITNATVISTFLAQPSVKYDAANWKKSIATQMWVSLYDQGYDAWREWRRLDFPKLKVAQAPLNPSEAIPLRNMYPETEKTLNTANYNAVIGKLTGGDTDGAKLWWDKF
ncbi:MAG: SusD/RagB family nutrient-binding outer membrane lipoprotein [Saprospiraceae bacterium]|nr:SusD/RagB family nutrient-binding outer membrane lipoprotein [Saprospiraceae bacterium]